MVSGDLTTFDVFDYEWCDRFTEDLVELVLSECDTVARECPNTRAEVLTHSRRKVEALVRTIQRGEFDKMRRALTH